MNVLHISLLGDFQLEYNGELFTAVTSPRLQSALAYLVLHSHAPQLRRHMAFQLWPDSTERQAYSNLRKVVYQLRSALSTIKTGATGTADRWLNTDAQTIHWQPDIPCTVDVVDFEANLRLVDDIVDDPQAQHRLLAESISLYCGDLLPSCYDEWITPLRERLYQLLIGALGRLVWLAEAQRDYPTAIRCAQQLLQHDPLHEMTYRRLMQLYAVEGNRARALQTYHTCAMVLQNELGIEPGPETQQVYAHLLETKQPTVQSAQQQKTEAGPLQLVGRQSEWQILRSTWQRTVDGQPHFVLIRGEAGIGKTRLAEELFSWTEQQDFAAVRTRSYAAQGALAYTPAVDWLRTTILRPNRQALDGIWLSELARLMPELLSQHPDLPTPEPLTERWQRNRLFEALARATVAIVQKSVSSEISNAGKRGLLLLLDDLQWCDRDTLEWLHYLLQFDPHAPVLIVGTMRPDEVDGTHPLTALILELHRTEQITEISLGPLDRVETAALATQVTAHTLDEKSLAWIYQTTEGSPLFIVETMRAKEWRDDITGDQSPAIPQVANLSLPPKVYTTIQYRLNQLSPVARNLACLAAAIGRSFPLELLQAVGDQEEHDLIICLDELWQRGIIRTGGNQVYDFSHDRIREVAYSEIGPVQRPHLHRRIANALYQLHNNDLDQIAAHLSSHYDAAGATEEAVIWYQRAADVQRKRYALTEAILYQRRALALLVTLPQGTARNEQELTMLLDLNQDLNMAIGYGATEKHAVLSRAVDLAQAVGDSWRLYLSLSALAGHHLAKSGPLIALEFHAKVVPIASAIQNLAVQAEAHYRIARTNMHLGNFTTSHQQFQHAYSLITSDTYDQAFMYRGMSLTYRPNVYGNTSMVLWLLGYPEQALTWIDGALQLRGQEELEHFRFGSTLHFGCNIFRLLQDVARVQSLANDLIAVGIHYGENPTYLNGLNFQGWALAQQGDFAGSIDSLTEGIAGFRAMDHTMFQTYRLAMLAEVYILANDFSAANATLEEAFAISERVGEQWWDAELHRLQGHVLSAANVPVVKIEHCYQQAITIAREQQAKSLELRATLDLARLWQRQDRIAEARSVLSKIYGWFTEGLQTADLRSASALLTQLS